MNNKITVAKFKPEETTSSACGLNQWNYGQILRIEGLSLPPAVEIHFSLQEKCGEAVRRIGTTKDGVTDVVIPDSMLENESCPCDSYYIYAWIYTTDETSGQTEYQIRAKVKTRSKPEAFDTPDAEELFREAIKAVNECADRAEYAGTSAEAWARGHVDYPERDQDNAKYYAKIAKDAVEEIPGQVKDAKKEIDQYVSGKEAELKGETGNVYFAAFKVVNGRLKMYSDPNVDKVRFARRGSRLSYRLAM